MSMPALHYIFDPLCGWCYAVSPLIAAARERMPVHLHAGGMMAGPQRQRVTPQLRRYVLAHDERIAQVSGQPFGDSYRHGLLRDSGAVFDSEPPITAVLAAEAVAGRGLDLLQRIQRAHYVEGRRIAERRVLTELATDIGLDAVAFADAFARQSGPATARHIADSRSLLAEVGGNGFPTLVVRHEAGVQRVDVSPFLGDIERWRAWLDRNVALPARPEGDSVGCLPEGCYLPERRVRHEQEQPEGRVAGQ